MELLQCLVPSLHLLHLNSCELLPGEHRLTLNLTSTQTQATGPICSQYSHRIHSLHIGFDWVQSALVDGWRLIKRVAFSSNKDSDPAMASLTQHEKRSYRLEFQVFIVHFKPDHTIVSQSGLFPYVPV